MSDGMKWIVVIAGCAVIVTILLGGMDAGTEGGGFRLKIDPGPSVEAREENLTAREITKQQGETERTRIREENETDRAELGQQTIRWILVAIVIIAAIWFIYDLRRRRLAAKAELASLHLRLTMEEQRRQAERERAPQPTWRPMPMPAPQPMPMPAPRPQRVQIEVTHSWRPGQSIAHAPAHIQGLWDMAAARHGDGGIDIVDSTWHYVNPAKQIMVPLAPVGYLPAPKD